MAETNYVYVGTLPCGCRICVVIDEGARSAKDVAKFIKRGCAVTRETGDEYRAKGALGLKCDACKAARAAAIARYEAKAAKASASIGMFAEPAPTPAGE